MQHLLCPSKTTTTKVQFPGVGAPMSLWSLLTEAGCGVAYRSVGYPKQPHWKAFTGYEWGLPHNHMDGTLFPSLLKSLYLSQRHQSHMQLGQNCKQLLGRTDWILRWGSNESPSPSFSRGMSEGNLPSCDDVLQADTADLVEMVLVWLGDSCSGQHGMMEFKSERGHVNEQESKYFNLQRYLIGAKYCGICRSKIKMQLKYYQLRIMWKTPNFVN